jgi:hypothetical protein
VPLLTQSGHWVTSFNRNYWWLLIKGGAPLGRRTVNTSPTPALHYFIIMRLGAVLGVCSAGEITNVTQVFQPSGRLSWANSL